jgi:excisionase family DNA binding protein
MLTSVMIDQAAEILGVSRRTVYYRIREGRLLTIRTIGGSQRVLLESIQALLRQDPDAFRTRGAGVSGRGPSARSPVPWRVGTLTSRAISSEQPGATRHERGNDDDDDD